MKIENFILFIVHLADSTLNCNEKLKEELMKDKTNKALEHAKFDKSIRFLNSYDKNAPTFNLQIDKNNNIKRFYHNKIIEILIQNNKVKDTIKRRVILAIWYLYCDWLYVIKDVYTDNDKYSNFLKEITMELKNISNGLPILDCDKMNQDILVNHLNLMQDTANIAESTKDGLDTINQSEFINLNNDNLRLLLAQLLQDIIDFE